MIYILKHTAPHLLVWNNAQPQIRKRPHKRRLSPRRIMWPFICSDTMSSVLWHHHFMSRSRHPQDHLLSRNIWVKGYFASSKLRLTTNAGEFFHSRLSKHFYHPHPDINLFTSKLTECQNMICVKLRSANLPAKVTNLRSNVAEGLVDDKLKKKTKQKEEKFLGYNLIPKFVTDSKTWFMIYVKNKLW